MLLFAIVQLPLPNKPMFEVEECVLDGRRSKNGIVWWPREKIKARMPKLCKEVCTDAV